MYKIFICVILARLKYRIFYISEDHLHVILHKLLSLCDRKVICSLNYVTWVFSDKDFHVKVNYLEVIPWKNVVKCMTRRYRRPRQGMIDKDPRIWRHQSYTTVMETEGSMPRYFAHQRAKEPKYKLYLLHSLVENLSLGMSRSPYLQANQALDTL